MNTLIAKLADWLKGISLGTTKKLQGEDLDWRNIDETKSRLVQMRFKSSATPPAAEASPETAAQIVQGELIERIAKPSKELSDTFQIGGGGVRSRDRDTLTRWFSVPETANTASTQKLSKEMRESIGKKKTADATYFTDRDFNFSPSDSSYEPLVLPGITYELHPSPGSDRISGAMPLSNPTQNVG